MPLPERCAAAQAFLPGMALTVWLHGEEGWQARCAALAAQLWED